MLHRALPGPDLTMATSIAFQSPPPSYAVGKVRAVAVPSESLAFGALERIDYADAFEIQFRSDHDLEVADLARSFFPAAPWWTKALLAVREVFAKAVGLKTADRARVRKELREFSGARGQSIALFRVYERSRAEIVMGEDDSHLLFRVSFILKRESDLYTAVLSTVVQFMGASGRAYFLPVRPLHKLIVPAMLRRMAHLLREHGPDLPAELL